MSTAEVGAPREPEELVLAAEFPAATREQWAELVDAVVRRAGRLPADAEPGAGVGRLERTTADGIRVRPLYTAEDLPDAPVGVPGAAPFVRGARPAGPVPDGWDVRQRHAEPDPEVARRAIVADLSNGVSSIWLAVGAGGTAVADLAAVLDEVHLDLAPVVLDAGPDQEAAAETFLALAGDREVDPGVLLGTLGLDPIGLRARTGSGPEIGAVVPLARRVAAEFPRVRALVVDAGPVHEAGGSDAQELGFSLAAGVAYLRALTEAGLDLGTAAGLLEFRYAATVEQFPTIAKLRAARRLWSRVTGACGGPAAQAQHAVGSPVMLTRRDPYVNLLRGTVAGFAAGVAGADAVTVAPFDALVADPGAFSRRIARNTQALLVQEAHLARVLDPAGGSWFVESLTAELATAAWAFFQEIEAAGGAIAALDAGLIAERTAAVRAQRTRDVATRRTPITGVSEFPNLAEKPLDRGPRGGSTDTARRQGHLAGSRGGGGGLPVFRLAEPFEAHRDRSDAVLAATGARPRAFLATLGPLAAHTARAGFARNLLQAGGVETPDAGPTDTADEVAAAFRAAGTPVAVLCGTDEHYAERGAATAAALRDAGARQVLLAGRADVPGVDGLLHVGCDALAVIDAVHRALEGTT
ncbi:MAG TPA: methylmalonyl-CoA mutase family protein [Pseudonocardia sp.]|nr:methylmalonyl-CoA mutase family protein [Pseudonocardia sp.]